MTTGQESREEIAALRRASRSRLHRQLGLAVGDARRACGLEGLAREHPLMLVCGACAGGFVAGAALVARRRPAPAHAAAARADGAPARSPWLGMLIQALATGVRGWMSSPAEPSDADPSHPHQQQQPGAQP